MQFDKKINHKSNFFVTFSDFQILNFPFSATQKHRDSKKPILEAIRELYSSSHKMALPSHIQDIDSHMPQREFKVKFLSIFSTDNTTKNAKNSWPLKVGRDSLLEMVRNNHKREELYKQMDAIMK